MKELSLCSQGLVQSVRLYSLASLPLGRLGLGLSKTELATLSFTEVQAKLAELYGGAAATNAETFQGKISRDQAIQMLKSGYGLDDEAINTWLGDETYEQRFDDLDTVISVFDEYGTKASEYEVIKSREIFSSQDADLVEQEFAEPLVTDSVDAKILEIISKNKLVPPKDIAKAVKITLPNVLIRIDTLVELGVLNYDPINQVSSLTKPLDELIKPMKTTFLVRYSYEWKSIVPSGQRDTPAHPSRPFCKKLMALEKLYSRAEMTAGFITYRFSMVSQLL